MKHDDEEERKINLFSNSIQFYWDNGKHREEDEKFYCTLDIVTVLASKDSLPPI